MKNSYIHDCVQWWRVAERRNPSGIGMNEGCIAESKDSGSVEEGAIALVTS